MGIIGWIVLIGALWYFFGGGGRRSGCLTNIIVGLVVLWIFDHFSLGQIIWAAIVGWFVQLIF
jgi:hypothetical protein